MTHRRQHLRPVGSVGIDGIALTVLRG